MGVSLPPPGHAEPMQMAAAAAAPAPTPRRRRPQLIAGAVALVIVAAAGFFLLFGSSGSNFSGPIAQAATLSSTTPGYRIKMSMELTSPALGSPITASGRGVVDARDNATSMTFTINWGNEPALVQGLGASTMRLAMITDGGTVFARFPAAVTTALPTNGRPWVKLHLSKLAGLPGMSSFGGNPTTSDPSYVLQFLKSNSTGVAEVGHQRVDGVLTTHYRAELSLDHLLAGLPSAQGAVAQQALAMLKQSLETSEMPVEVWIDAHHLVRRVVMDLDLELPVAGSMQESVAVDLSDYGPQRRPATPPAQQVTDLSSLGS